MGAVAAVNWVRMVKTGRMAKEGQPGIGIPQREQRRGSKLGSNGKYGLPESGAA